MHILIIPVRQMIHGRYPNLHQQNIVMRFSQ